MDLLDLVPWIFALIGPALIVVGIRSLRATARFHRRALQAYGVITQLRRESTGEKAATYPVVRFDLPDGRTVETTARHGSPIAGEGDPVTVLYDPDNPANIRLAGVMGSGHLGGVVLIFMGIGFLVLGGGIGTIFLLAERATS
jgi:Protein of unknown function (DUF3592)